MIYRSDEVVTFNQLEWAVICLTLGFGGLCLNADPGVAKAAFTVGAITLVNSIVRRTINWFQRDD